MKANKWSRSQWAGECREFGLSKAVVRFRKSCGLSQRDLGKVLGIGQTHIWRIEKGYRNVSKGLIERIEREIGLPIEFWFSHEEAPHAD